MRKQTKCQSHCPFCGSTNIDWDEDGIEDDYYYYEYHCNDCNKEFTEWYSLHYCETEYNEYTPEELAEQQLRERERTTEHNKMYTDKIKQLLQSNEDNLTNADYISITRMMQDTTSLFYNDKGYFDQWKAENYIKTHSLTGSLKPTPEQLRYFEQTGYKSWQ